MKLIDGSQKNAEYNVRKHVQMQEQNEFEEKLLIVDRQKDPPAKASRASCEKVKRLKQLHTSVTAHLKLTTRRHIFAMHGACGNRGLKN